MPKLWMGLLQSAGAQPLSAELIALDERAPVPWFRPCRICRVAAMRLPRKSGRRWLPRNSELAEKLKKPRSPISRHRCRPAEEEERTILVSPQYSALADALSRIPNVPLDEVPVGKRRA